MQFDRERWKSDPEYRAAYRARSRQAVAPETPAPERPAKTFEELLAESDAAADAQIELDRVRRSAPQSPRMTQTEFARMQQQQQQPTPEETSTAWNKWFDTLLIEALKPILTKIGGKLGGMRREIDQLAEAIGENFDDDKPTTPQEESKGTQWTKNLMNR